MGADRVFGRNTGSLKDDSQMYEDIFAKQKLLQEYLKLCGHNVSGKRIQVPIHVLADNLMKKAEWLKNISVRQSGLEKMTERDGLTVITIMQGKR